MVSRWPAAVADGWHPVAYADEVRRGRARAARLMGRRLVLARDAAGVFVLDDRCPHRGAPLSKGRITNGVLVCPYHGWRFARDGRCLAVPGSDDAGVAARALPCIERAGLIWTTLAVNPSPFPGLPPVLEDTALDRFWWPLRATRAGLLDAIENHLDPAHPHYVHPWMVRADARRRAVDVTVRTGTWGGEAVYVERGRPAGLMPRLLEGERTASIGRYYPPTIAEIAFAGPRGVKLSVAVVFAPEDHGLTRPYAHFATPRGRAPAWLKRLALKLLHRPVLAQDRRVLAWQEEWRGEDAPAYATGPLDLLGPTIWRLANGRAEPERERTLRLLL